MIFKVATLNAGLLSFFWGRVEPTPFVRERAWALAAQLRSVDACFVAIQEIYRKDDRLSLASELRDLYPHSGYVQRRRHFGLENGLMALSKRPLNCRLDLFHDAPFDETWFDSKGILTCEVELGSGHTLSIINVHTTAGGSQSHPESRMAEAIRSRQIDQIMGVVLQQKGLVMLVGDLNAGPGVSEVNFQEVLRRGFVSVHDLLHGGLDPTWDPANPLNVGSPHRLCPPQRIDHIFVRGSDLDSGVIRAINSRICLNENVVKMKDGSAYTVSDHFGLCAEVEIHL